MPRNGSQAGYGVVLASPAIAGGPAPAVLAEAVSTRIKRTVRSSMAAEMGAASLALEHTEFARAAWAELLHPQFELRAWQYWAAKWRLYLVMDAKTGFDALEGDTTATDRRVALDIAAMKETLDEPAHEAGVRWVPGPQHFADGLTKLMHNGILDEVMAGQGWSLREDPGVRAKRAELVAAQKARAATAKAQLPG
eukprot:1435448-Lingulodinium_polyedra.AAC.1